MFSMLDHINRTLNMQITHINRKSGDIKKFLIIYINLDYCCIYDKNKRQNMHEL